MVEEEEEGRRLKIRRQSTSEDFPTELWTEQFHGRLVLLLLPDLTFLFTTPTRNVDTFRKKINLSFVYLRHQSVKPKSNKFELFKFLFRKLKLGGCFSGLCCIRECGYSRQMAINLLLFVTHSGCSTIRSKTWPFSLESVETRTNTKSLNKNGTKLFS